MSASLKDIKPRLREFREDLVRMLYRKPPRDFPVYMRRPIVESDLAESAPHQIADPAFIGVGVPKAGTSWWMRLLQQHPQVGQPQTRNAELNKELLFFPHLLSDPSLCDKAYRRALSTDSAKELVVGEFSPYYLFCPGSLEEIATRFRHTKIVVILCDPVTRAISHLNFLAAGRADIWHLNVRPGAQYVFEIFDALPHAVYCSSYYFPLMRLYRLFESSMILVLQYEKCVSDPLGQYYRTCEFLGIDQGFIPSDIQRPVNRNPHRFGKLDEAAVRQALRHHLDDDTSAVLGLKRLNLDPELWGF